VDITGFDRSIWERCELLRNQSIPMIVISPKQSATIRQETLAHGADSLLVKPVVTRELLGVIRHLLE
jgi:DNA-binding response OmpR family regulator